MWPLPVIQNSVPRLNIESYKAKINPESYCTEKKIIKSKLPFQEFILEQWSTSVISQNMHLLHEVYRVESLSDYFTGTEKGQERGRRLPLFFSIKKVLNETSLGDYCIPFQHTYIHTNTFKQAF